VFARFLGFGFGIVGLPCLTGDDGPVVAWWVGAFLRYGRVV